MLKGIPPLSYVIVTPRSLLNSPEVQALYHKKSSNNVTAVTPLNQPSKAAAAAIAGDSLVVIDFHAPAAVSEKKKTPIKHSASVGDQPLSTISPALYSQSSHHSNDHSSGKKQRHAVIHKQHTTGEIPDHPNSQPRSRAVIPKQHSSEDNHHSSKHHQSSSKKHHHVATDSSDPSDSPLHSAKHSTKSSKSPPNGGGEWVTASRKEFY